MHRAVARPSANARHSNTVRAHGRQGDRLAAGNDLSTASFYFAKLSLNEIQEDLTACLQRPITMEMLKNPTSDMVKEIVGFFIAEVYQKQPEDLAQPAFGVIDQLDHPELYDDHAKSQMTFLRFARKLFAACMFDDFGLRDLHSPEKSRFHLQLSALVNYTRFRQTRLAIHEEMTCKEEDRMKKEKELREAKTKLQHSISEIEAVRAKEEPELANLKARVNEQGLILASHHEKQQALTEKTHERKEVLTRMNDEAVILRDKLATERSDVERMQSKVVASPDRVKAEFENMAVRLDSENEHIESVRFRSRMLIAREEGFKKVIVLMENLRNVNRDTVEKMKESSNLKADLEKLKAKKAELQHEMKTYQETKESLERQIASMDNRISRIDEQTEGIVTRKTDVEIKRAEAEKSFRTRYEECCRVRDETIANANKIQMEIETLVENHANEVSNTRKSQQQMRDKLRDFEKDMSSVYEIYAATNESGRKSFDQLVNSWQNE